MMADRSGKDVEPVEKTQHSRRREIDPKLLELLVCPLTKGPLRFDAALSELVSRAANLAYPVREGIPVMLASEARRTDSDVPRT